MTGTLDISESPKLTMEPQADSHVRTLRFAPGGGTIGARLGPWQLRPTFFADVSNRISSGAAERLRFPKRRPFSWRVA